MTESRHDPPGGMTGAGRGSVGGNPEEVSAILEAVCFAADRHASQRRKDDETPYINHPLDVALELCQTGGVRELPVLLAAILHDILEDTDTSAEELEERFGLEVRLLVEEVSDDKRLPKAERKRLQVINAPNLSKGAKLLKLADKISNVRDVSNCPPPDWSDERRVEYLDWTAKVLEGCRGTNHRLEVRYDQVLQEGRRLIDGG